MTNAMTTEDRLLKSIAGDLRLVGIVLAVLGTLVGIGASSQARGDVAARLVGVAGLTILLLPGVWFAVAASLVRGGRGARIVTWSMRVVAVQSLACVLAVGVAIFDGRGTRATMPIVVPLIFIGVFAPAQAALVWQLVRARNLIDARDARRGFAAATETPVAEVVALPVDADASAVPIAQARDDAR